VPQIRLASFDLLAVPLSVPVVVLSARRPLFLRTERQAVSIRATVQSVAELTTR
jgi:hypothetical protein